MFVAKGVVRASLLGGNLPVTITQVATMKCYKPPIRKEIEYPERVKLKVMEKVPRYPPGMRAFKMPKKLSYMRGPETIHNTLLYQQFGVIATGGGRLNYRNFEFIRMTLTRKLNYNKLFAVWRVEAPWQPVTKKSQGQRMGGGKGAIDHYVTPVRTGRVIFEVGGDCEYFEVEPLLTNIAKLLPFKAVAVNHESLQKRIENKEWLEKNNLNPWTFKYIVQNNIGGCWTWMSPKDKLWFGKYT